MTDLVCIEEKCIYKKEKCIHKKECPILKHFYEQGRADAIEEYNGYRKKVIDITIREDFKYLKRIATVNISEQLLEELPQEELLRIIVDEISEQMQKGAGE